ncbi:HlyD family type I secretion periplasmic adaptor subunit [Ruegeria lacuscaerulensis]|uniref:HlyD family type I secretion periplasmic adaptor subunit n=2 Tax=Ruegeria lacuscaerulensis TaxID=55218 RepID=UPI00147CC4C0
MTRKEYTNTKPGPMARAVERRRKKPPRFAAFLTLVFFLMICGLVTVAGRTMMPQITRAPGTIMPIGDYPQIETLHGGIVKEVHVRNGQRVEAGDVLVELEHPDLTQERDLAAEQIEAIQRDLENAMTVLAMLNRAVPPSVSEIKALEAQGLVTASSRLQLFFERQRIQQTSLEQQKETLDILRQAADLANRRVVKKEELLAKYAQLQAQGFKSLSDYLEEEDEVDAVRSAASAASVRLAEAQSALILASSTLQEETLSLRDDVLTRISELEKERDRLRVSQQIVAGKLAGLRIVAPARGVIQSVAFPNLGEVIAPGETIFEILPTRQALIVEARIPNAEVGHVNADDPVSISVDTFDVRRFGKVEGQLNSIYPLPLTDEKTGETYFRASLALAQVSVGTGSFARPLQAGMTVVAEMKTGEQTLLAYLLKPVQTTLDRAFKER